MNGDRERERDREGETERERVIIIDRQTGTGIQTDGHRVIVRETDGQRDREARNSFGDPRYTE